MSTSRSDDPRFVRFYARLVRLYPRAHRARFEAGMVQVFRDRLRHCPGPRARMVWRLRAVFELLWTLPAAHWEERPVFHPASLAGAAGGLTFLAVFLGVLAVTSFQPRIYLGSCRLEMPSAHRPLLLLGGPGLSVVDPFQRQAEAEAILADDSLLAVGRDLDLGSYFAQEHGVGDPLDPGQVAQILRRQLEVRQVRDTHLLEVRSYFRDAAVGAEVANRVVEEYRRRRAATDPNLAVRVVDPAVPGLRPVAPNVPLNLGIGLLSAGGLGLLVFLAAWLVLRWRRNSTGTLISEAS